MIGAHHLLIATALALPMAAHAQGKNSRWDLSLQAFTMPSESMEPSVPPGSYLIAKKRNAVEVQRGDIVAIRVNDSIWIKRVAGLPGDRFRMVDGKVILNGKAVEYGPGQPYALYNGRDEGVQRSEKFPGESAPHMVVQLRQTPQDNTQEVLVPANRLFLLGDNRDNSADSRFSHEEGGLETVAFEDVYGVIDPKHIARRNPPPPVLVEPSSAITPIE